MAAPPTARRFSRNRPEFEHASDPLRRSWLPEGLPENVRAQVVAGFDDELRRQQQANPELVAVVRQLLDIGDAKTSQQQDSAVRLGDEVVSNVTIDGAQLRASVATVMEFSHRVDGKLLGRGAALPHEARFARALEEAARAYRENDDAWRDRERVGRLSKELAALGLDEDTPARQAQQRLEHFARQHGILPADAATASDRVQRAVRALSSNGPTAGGRHKAAQRALAELLSEPGFKDRNIAEDEALSGFEGARLTARRPIEKPTSLQDVKDALERATRVARRSVLGKAIDAGVDVTPLLDSARREGDAELELQNRAALASGKSVPSRTPPRGRLLPPGVT